MQWLNPVHGRETEWRARTIAMRRMAGKIQAVARARPQLIVVTALFLTADRAIHALVG